MDTLRVLHVDDEPGFRDLVEDVLEQEDDRIEVISEARAPDGLESLRTEQREIDCVVSDYDMPGMDGIEFLDAVREDFPELPFILFTGKGSEAVASDAIASGATDYLQKSSGTEQFELLANQVVNAVKRYRAQQERERVYQALETATQGIGILDENGEYVYLNEAYADLYARDQSDILGDHWERLYPEEEIDRFRTDILPTLEQQGHWTGRSTGIRADGSTFAEQLSLTQLNTGGHVCVVQDLSEQLERERELQQKERRYQAIFEDPNLLVGLLDVDGTLERVNQTALQFVSQDRERVVGQPFWETPWWAHSEQLRQDVKRWVERATTGEYVEFEADHSISDSVPHHVEGTLRPVTDENGTVVSVIASARDITARKEYENELQWKTNALDEAPVGVAITDATLEDNPITYVNKHFEQLTGYSGAEIRGLSWRVLQGEHTTSDAVETIRTAIETEEPVAVELRNYTKDGSMFWNRVTIAPVTADADTTSNFVWFHEDVTERKETEQRLQAYIENASDALAIVSDSGVFEELSPSIERITGYEPAHLVGDSAFEYIHPDDRELVRDAFAELHEAPAGATRRFEYRFERPDGSWLWLESTGQSQNDPHLDGHLITTRAIQERKEQEHALIEQNRKITALHQVATEIVSSESPEEVYRTVVETAKEILQLDIGIADAAVGDVLIPRAVSSELSIDQYYEQTRIDAEDNFAAQAYRSGESIVIEDLTDHDVSPATPEFRSVLTVPIGEHGIFQTVDREPRAFDETDRKLAELLISRAETRLDQLESEQHLRDQTEKLERQNERLEEFASVVSHDLRNPLNLASTALELVKQDCESEHIEKVERGHGRMEALIENLLTLAREDESVTAIDTVDLGLLSQDCWQMVATEQATLISDVDTRIEADRGRLRQLLANLMRNAIEHGGDSVTLEIGALQDGFYVEDDGPGIPPDERDSVFESGYTTAESGTGFGLSIVEAVIEAHGWESEITEGDAGGARFEIRGVTFA